MEIDLINLITILNLHLFWEEYSKITHNFSNYNNKHFKHFRYKFTFIYLTMPPFILLLSFETSPSPFSPPQKLDNSSQMPLLSHSSLIAISFSPFLFALLLFLVLHLFFFSFSLSFPTGFISFFIGTREDARCAGQERNHRIGLCRPR